MKRKIKKSLILTSVLFSVTVVGLAFTPHVTCGCGQYEDGSQLTHLLNSVSETLIGKPVIQKKPSPFK